MKKLRKMKISVVKNRYSHYGENEGIDVGNFCNIIVRDEIGEYEEKIEVVEDNYLR